MILLNQKFPLELFFESLKKGEKSLLILDYDGTLAPFANNPALAIPYPGVFERITKLIETKRTKVVIISGRNIESLKKIVPISNIELWGSHGAERLLVNSTRIISFVNVTPEIRRIFASAAKKAQEIAPELYVEIKPFSVALHWRGKNPLLAEPVALKWRELIFNQPLVIQPFDGGIELRLIGINKGTAVKRLLEELSGTHLVAYLGDDQTDEDAFQVLQNKGLKILVRKELRDTLADVYIRPPEELLDFLDRWLNAIKS